MSIFNDKTIFKKITHVIDGNCINNIVKKYNSDFRSQHFNTRSHIYSMLYLQLSETKSLRGLIDKLQSSPKLKNIINVPSVSQLSRKNASRDYRVFEDLYFYLMDIANRKIGFSLKNKYFNKIKAFDSTVIQIASSLAPNLNYENNKSGIKISTLYNVSRALPERVNIVPARVNDRKCISEFISDKDVLYLFDRGYFDYSWYDKLTDDGFKFITRQVSNATVEEIRSTYVENDLVFDSEITLGTNYSRNKTRNSYREILTFNEEQEEIRLLTNIFDIPAEEIIKLYKLR
ncbi:IS4 family transposase [Alkalithermobacter paradoxus]|uniref:Transposase DDE domain protein n=1 Tax=Alkalithermobacter paradoxus TaxID=29349 RepID=A0A1V4IAG8_9FIRM|nr:transposase DDE domain protein [[Clostridium] thermoalcaliphilum]